MTRALPPAAPVVISAVTALLWGTMPPTSVSAAATATPHTPPRDTSGVSVTGTVFRDIDHDGRRDPGEPPVPGVTIRAGIHGTASATGDEGPAAGTVAATTDIAGRYELRGLGTVGRRLRIEVASTPPGLYPGPGGRHGADDVRFVPLVTGPRVDSSATDIGLVDPTDYCQARPRVAVACQYAAASTLPAAVQAVPWAAAGRARSFGPGRAIGAVWGLAWQRDSGRLLAAAFVTPHAPLGFGGAGAVYALRPTSRTSKGDAQVRVLARLPAGTVAADVAGRAAQVGTVGLGGLDISADGRELYVMNLHDRRLYVIPVTNPRDDESGDGWPAMAGSAVGYRVPDPGCDAGDARPFAVRAYRTTVYVGVTCDGGRLGSSGEARVYRQLTGQVYSFDTRSRRFDPTPRLRFHFDGAFRCPTASPASAQTCHWRPWLAQPTVGAVPMNGQHTNRGSGRGTSLLLTAHQPWLSDIDVLGTGDSDGDLLITIMDRLGHQVADGSPAFLFTSRDTGSAAAAKSRGGHDAGTRLRVVPVGGSLRAVRRGDGSYSLVDSATARFASGGGLGGLAHRDGGESLVAVTAVTSDGPGLVYVRAADARQVRVTPLVTGRVTAAGDRATVVGLSEPELMCDAAPLQIGDRVWRDDNGDGIQGADEPGIAGVAVSLRDSRGRLVATTETDRDGRYRFTDDDVPGGLARHARYQVTLSRTRDFAPRGPLAGTRLAPSGVGDETVDSDAQVPRPADVLDANNVPTVTVTTAGSGRYHHGNDIGIMPPGVRASPPAVSPTGADASGRGGSASVFDPVMLTGLSGGLALFTVGAALLLLRRRLLRRR